MQINPPSVEMGSPVPPVPLDQISFSNIHWISLANFGVGTHLLDEPESSAIWLYCSYHTAPIYPTIRVCNACIVLYCIVLYCTVLYCIVLYLCVCICICIVVYRIVLQCIFCMLCMLCIQIVSDYIPSILQCNKRIGIS